MHGIDFVMIPYIVSKDDVKEVKKRLTFLDRAVIISKLDDKRSFEEFWEITNESGGIFIHRENLSHSLNPEKLYSLTKFLTEQCNIMSKPFIVEISGINGQNPISNRREICDIETSILEGVDVILIDHETSVGKNPVEVVQIVSKALA